MQSGRMRHRVTLLQPGQRDNLGNPGQPTMVATLWAEITALSGNELYKAQQIVSQVTHRVRIRWYPGIRSKMTVQFTGPGSDGPTRTFEILTPMNPDERTRQIDLLCMERNDGR